MVVLWAVVDELVVVALGWVELLRVSLENVQADCSGLAYCSSGFTG